jgi:ferritin-like metal-binding protein YciE
MNLSDQKVVQYLGEAHASEIGLVSVLRSQIAMTPRGSYRDGLEKHLVETRKHAGRVQQRLGELEHGRNPLQVLVGFTETLISQALALSKTPFDVLRGTSGEEKVLKNAKDAYATEALEIATYTALERLAIKVGDDRTAQLAFSIRGDEERMLERIMREIPRLTDKVIGADVNGEPSYDIMETGAADTARELAHEVKQTARATETRARRTARQARKVPGVVQVEGQIKGAVASEEDLAIPRYDSLTAEEIISKLPELSQIDLAKIDSYERREHNRTTVLSRITALRGEEPWPGYDELTVAEIEAVLGEGDKGHAKDVAAYERAHKNRAGVLRSAQRETANSLS